MGLYLMASKMGVYESDLAKILQGKASYGIASKLNVYESDLQILLNKAGGAGAIGIILGILME